VRLHQTSGSKPFFAQQSQDLEQQLKAAEQALREAKNRMGVGSIESRRSTLEQRLASIELNRNGVIQSVAAGKARIEALTAHAKAMPDQLHTSTKSAPNTGADALRSQLYALQVQLMNLEAKYSQDHPLVASTRQQVEEAQRMLGEEAPSREETFMSINANQRALLLELAQVESAQAGHEAEMAELDRQLDAVMKDLRKLNDDEVEIQELGRRVTLAQKNFFGYAEDLELARIDEELDRLRMTNIADAQPATLAEKPVSPSKMLVGALSLLLATAGTAALVLTCEKCDSRVHNEDQVESVLRLPVLAAVPEGRVYATAGGAGS
jgi:uncharacterized protein involved in exopolysaccharide biosynthesis